MEFIIADKQQQDLAPLEEHAYLDLDIGKTNDFLLKINLQVYDKETYMPGNMIYCMGTEYGGIMDDPEVSTSGNTISFTGDTFRGMLFKKYILPPEGQAYKTISGELNSCIKELIGNQFGTDLFIFDDADTGVSVTDYQFDRYCSLYSGIDKLLTSVDHRLKIECVQAGDHFSVRLSAVPVIDHSDLIETSQDSNVNFTITKYTNKYNYMLCLGKGELTERTVIYLHLADDGSVEQVNEIPAGAEVKVYLYDYPNVESEKDLIEAGKDKFKDINSTDTQKMTIPDGMNLEIGDIVGGRDYVTGMTISQEVTQKILKLQNKTLKISYTVGDGE